MLIGVQDKEGHTMVDILTKQTSNQKFSFKIYVDDVEAAKKDLGVLEITPKTASYLDHRTHPIFMRKFEF